MDAEQVLGMLSEVETEAESTYNDSESDDMTVSVMSVEIIQRVEKAFIQRMKIAQMETVVMTWMRTEVSHQQEEPQEAEVFEAEGLGVAEQQSQELGEVGGVVG